MDDIAVAIAQTGLQDARRKGFEDGIRAAANWLRRQVRAEADPVRRRILVEAFNSIRRIQSR